MILILQVLTRTEGVPGLANTYPHRAHVIIRGASEVLSEPIEVRLTEEEFKELAPGKVFRAELKPLRLEP